MLSSMEFSQTREQTMLETAGGKGLETNPNPSFKP